MKKKCACIFLSLTALYAVFLVLGSTIRPFGQFFLHREKACVGDLYKIVKIDFFKEEQPCATIKQIPEEVPPDQANLFLFGDSFFNGEETGELFKTVLASQFEKNSGIKIHNVYESIYPLNELRKRSNALQGNRERKKVLVLETAERYLFYLTSTTLLNDLSGQKQLSHSEAKKQAAEAVATPTTLTKKHIDIKKFDVSRFEHFFLNNIFFHPLFTKLNTLRFWIFRSFSSLAVSEKYSLDPPLLILGEDIPYTEIHKDDALIEKTADRIASFQTMIQKLYGMDLIFLVIPNKYSIYGPKVDHKYTYDQAIPRLTAALESRVVPTLDTYSLFKQLERQNPTQKLYYSGDSHWTPFAKEAVAKALAEKLLPMLNNSH